MTPPFTSSSKPLNPPLPPPVNTADKKPISISKSLLGKEWGEKRERRNVELAKQLEEEEKKTLTFSPSINSYDLPDRTGDVLENMRRKENLRQARMERRKKLEKDMQPKYPFKPKILQHKSVTPASADEPVEERIQSEHDRAMLKLGETQSQEHTLDSRTFLTHSFQRERRTSFRTLTKGRDRSSMFPSSTRRVISCQRARGGLRGAT